MSPRAIALSIIFGIVGFGTAIGFLAGARRKMNLEQWTVAGRGFGVFFMYLLMAGEVYTTFSFLGASGWAYSRGGPTLYILAYLSLAYVVSFFILPPIWEMGQRHRLQTQSDFFRARYGNEYLAAFVCLVGVVSLVPYVQIQLTGLGSIVQIASFNGIGRTAAMVISALLVAGFVYASGVRAVAWVSVLKDALMLFTAVAIGVAIPHIYFGGIGHMFAALVHARPAHLTMPGATKNLGHTWFISTVLLTCVGMYMWPHAFGSAFTAKSGATLRRNAVVMPLYTTTIAFMFFAGFAAVLAVPRLSNGDLALLTIARKAFPPWFLGIIGGAGALTAMVPAAILTLTAATLFTKNLFRPVFAPRMNDDQVAKLARMMILVLTLMSLYFAIYSSATLVSLLLLGYAGVTQFFPGVVLGLYWKRVTASGVFAGMIAGVAVAAFLILSKRDPWFGWSAGFLALCLNFLVAIVVGMLSRERERADSALELPAEASSGSTST
ncbi:MAG: sodium:solute symporter family protein [Acidobacteriaceae bacterium]|nr:sodium:solute symporter family protein [Acidobacteriaceae bacterium]MBV9500273.1 sodium:solute symporter family protein [Acidobacteriaceae bacterium]